MPRFARTFSLPLQPRANNLGPEGENVILSRRTRCAKYDTRIRICDCPFHTCGGRRYSKVLSMLGGFACLRAAVFLTFYSTPVKMNVGGKVRNAAIALLLSAFLSLSLSLIPTMRSHAGMGSKNACSRQSQSSLPFVPTFIFRSTSDVL